MIRQNSPSFEIHLLAYASLLSLFGSGIFIMVQAQMISNMNLSDTIIAVDASASSPSCRHDHVFPFDQSRHQRVYKVGVLAIRGFEAAYNEFNQTFGDYLTATAGQRFDPPVKFELKPLDFMSLFTDTAGGLVDFVYANPSAFSCIESEFTAHSLVSQVSRRNINGNIHLLNKFGGVIFARNDRDDIRTIEDIRDKIVAAASISGLGSGQMQFLAMQQAGMSYINDPKQLVFTSNQEIVVNSVLNGEFDIGFVRTDQIERTKSSNGTLVDPRKLKILDPIPDLNIDGDPFPFESSTPLYPEWNVAALSHVPVDVSRALQEAMLAVGDHAEPAAKMQLCMNVYNSTKICKWENMSKPRCDTTQELSELALGATKRGKYSSWTTTLSYMQLRSMQEVTGLIQMDPNDNKWKCTRSSIIYDFISCPSGYYKASEDMIATACSNLELICKKGYQCICSPCSKIVECVDAVSIGDTCIAYKVFLPSVLVTLFLFIIVAVHFYVEYRRKQTDSVWSINAEELIFDEKPEILGHGSFGFVLLAEYRGTKVAVKKVLPPPKKGGSREAIFGNIFRTKHTTIAGNSCGRNVDVESGGIDTESEIICPGLKTVFSREKNTPLQNLKRGDHVIGLRSMAERLNSSMGSKSSKKATFRQLKADFVQEMRHLAKLRHPCITTVMGAVVNTGCEPMLVMEYMSRGSLYDVLRDESILDLDEHTLPILQDIAQGVRFLHVATPIVIHGDIKAKNVLIDTNFRAKVTDFGLGTKKKGYASGTPYWMAPELLRGECTNNEKSDIYSLGVLMYEVFSGRNPYEGESCYEVLKQVCDPEIKKRPPIPDSCSNKIGELIRNSMSDTPSFRPTAEYIDLTLRVEGSVKERVCKLEQLNAHLAVANERIEEASKMQLEHFACMSHEIRTPLNCIVGLSSLMEGTDLNPSQVEQIAMISASSKLLQNIVDDVLDYAKLQSGNAEVDIQKADIQRVVADLVKSMRASVIATKRNLSFSTYYGPRVTQYVMTDGRRLLQILFNLVSNAVKFSKKYGVVEVCIDICDRVESLGAPEKYFANDEDSTDEERKPLVKFGYSVLRLAVKDYGKGIEEKNFRKIFEPFTQTNSGVNNIDGGTGLGLAITEKLIRALGGDISVDSSLGEWTKFTVDLPYEGAPASGHQFKGKFDQADIYMVGPNKYIMDAFEFFRLSKTDVVGLNEFETILKSKSKLAREMIAIVSLIPADLFDGKMEKRLTREYGVQFVVLGTVKTTDESVRQYSSLQEVIPSVFIEELATMVEEVRDMTNSQYSNLNRADGKTLARAPCDLTHLRILCAEDNTVNQKILFRMLKRLGVPTIEMKDNGKLAVEEEARTEYDICLMDMQMPVMDGIDAVKEIVAREGGHKKPLIVFVTAHVSASFEAQCLDCGAAAYLPKPYTLPVLKETLLRATSRLGQQNEEPEAQDDIDARTRTEETAYNS